MSKQQFLTIAVLSVSTSFSSAAVVDLTTAGSSGYANEAYFQQIDPQTTGTGVIRPFVRIQSNKDIEQGYNTDARPPEFDENNSAQFTHSLRLSELGVETLNGINYYAFLLDINQTKSQPLLSLSKLEIYLGDTPDLDSYPSLGTKVYDMTGNVVKLNYSLNEGSGSGDMMAYIPVANFTPAHPYVYLYSEFGRPISGDSDRVSNNAGFEEWAAVSTPEPSTIGVSILGMLGMGVRRGRRSMGI